MTAPYTGAASCVSSGVGRRLAARPTIWSSGVTTSAATDMHFRGSGPILSCETTWSGARRFGVSSSDL